MTTLSPVGQTLWMEVTGTTMLLQVVVPRFLHRLLRKHRIHGSWGNGSSAMEARC